MGVVETASESYRLTKNGIQLWKESRFTKVTEIAEEGCPPPPYRPAGANQPRTLFTDDEDGRETDLA